MCVGVNGEGENRDVHGRRRRKRQRGIRDRVWTETGGLLVAKLTRGTRLSNGATVLCLVRSPAASGPRAICRVRPDIGLTPTHPVALSRPDVDDAWSWARELADSAPEEAEFVYNVVLDCEHTMQVGAGGDVHAITLGHGRGGRVLEHAFYGTHAVVEALRLDEEGWKAGVVTMPTIDSQISTHPFNGGVARDCGRVEAVAS